MDVATAAGTASRTTAVCGSSFCSAAAVDGATDVEMAAEIITAADADANSSVNTDNNFSSIENLQT